MKNLYESDKYETLNNIKYVSETIINRLYSTFESIEQEARLVEEKTFENSSRFFNPETMDETYGMEEAFHKGVDHYLIHTEMKCEFLNSTITWLFHLFEKDCNRLIGSSDGNEKLARLNDIGLNTSTGSLWSKCNTELRLIANTIKHGKGKSSNKLKTIKPDLFKPSFMGDSEENIQLTINHVKDYIKALKDFWGLFFSLVLPDSTG